MPLPSWLIRETERNGRHSHITIFVGPDADHRANAGSLALDHDEAEDLMHLLAGDTNRVEIQRAPPK